MKETFTTVELAKVLGKTSRFCISWTELGIFLADVQEAAGYASRREFSYRGLLRAYLAVYFHEKYGFQRKKIKNIIEFLWKVNLFREWEQEFPNAAKFMSMAAAKIPLEKKSEGGCIFIIDPYGKKPRMIPFSMSVADALRMLSEESIVETFAGLEDMIALNLYDLKKEIDKRINQMVKKK
ncbi:MAG: hypothetical protein ABSF13_11915 [Smithella sp.]|jgi:hypothetical protein